MTELKEISDQRTLIIEWNESGTVPLNLIKVLNHAAEFSRGHSAYSELPNCSEATGARP